MWIFTRSHATTSAPGTPPPPCPAAWRPPLTARYGSRQTSRRAGSAPASMASSWWSCSITRTCCCCRSGTPPFCSPEAASGLARKRSKASSANSPASSPLSMQMMIRPLKKRMTGRLESASGCGGDLNLRPSHFHTCLQASVHRRNASSCSWSGCRCLGSSSCPGT